MFLELYLQSNLLLQSNPSVLNYHSIIVIVSVPLPKLHQCCLHTPLRNHRINFDYSFYSTSISLCINQSLPTFLPNISSYLFCCHSLINLNDLTSNPSISSNVGTSTFSNFSNESIPE